MDLLRQAYIEYVIHWSIDMDWVPPHYVALLFYFRSPITWQGKLSLSESQNGSLFTVDTLSQYWTGHGRSISASLLSWVRSWGTETSSYQEDGTKYEIGGPLYFEFKEEEASPWTQNPCAYTTQSEPPRGLPEERLNGRLFDPSDSHPLTGLVPWTSATNAENCDGNYDACLSCWPIATPIHLSKHSRWSFFVAYTLSHEEGVERDFPNDFRWMCEPWYGDGDLLGASKPFLRAPTHPKSGGLFPVPRGLH